MSEHDTDLADVLLQFTNLIMNERVRSYNEGIDAQRASEGDYFKKMHGQFVAMLAERYADGDALGIANLCDGKFDQSGRLLGEVREVARAHVGREP